MHRDYNIPPPSPRCESDESFRPRTWEEITIAEPRLVRVINQARRCQRSRNKWSTYEYLKGRIDRLCGWGSDNPLFDDSHAYDLAIARVVKALRV